MPKVILIASFASILTFAQVTFANLCESYCAPMHQSFTKKNLFSADTIYFHLDDEVFKVQASTYLGLRQLCSNGYLLTDYEKVYIEPAAMGMGMLIDSGYYIKNAVGYKADSCMATVTESPGSINASVYQNSNYGQK